LGASFVVAVVVVFFCIDGGQAARRDDLA